MAGGAECPSDKGVVPPATRGKTCCQEGPGAEGDSAALGWADSVPTEYPDNVGNALRVPADNVAESRAPVANMGHMWPGESHIIPAVLRG